jgi:hypothetical protein
MDDESEHFSEFFTGDWNRMETAPIAAGAASVLMAFYSPTTMSDMRVTAIKAAAGVCVVLGLYYLSKGRKKDQMMQIVAIALGAIAFWKLKQLKR